MTTAKTTQDSGTALPAVGSRLDRRVRPLAYAMLWHSRKTWPAHSRLFAWADAVMMDEPGKTMWERYGAKGKPFYRDSNGQWCQVVPLWPNVAIEPRR